MWRRTRTAPTARRRSPPPNGERHLRRFAPAHGLFRSHGTGRAHVLVASAAPWPRWRRPCRGPVRDRGGRDPVPASPSAEFLTFRQVYRGHYSPGNKESGSCDRREESSVSSIAKSGYRAVASHLSRSETRPHLVVRCIWSPGRALCGPRNSHRAARRPNPRFRGGASSSGSRSGPRSAHRSACAVFDKAGGWLCQRVTSDPHPAHRSPVSAVQRLVLAVSADIPCAFWCMGDEPPLVFSEPER